MKSLPFSNDLLAAFLSFVIVAGLIFVGAIFLGCEQLSTPHQVDSEDTILKSSQPLGVEMEFESTDPHTGMLYAGVLYNPWHDIGFERLNAVFGKSSVAMKLQEMADAGHYDPHSFWVDKARTKLISGQTTYGGKAVHFSLALIMLKQSGSAAGDDSYAVIRDMELSGIVEIVSFFKVVYGTDPWNYWLEDDHSQWVLLGEDVATGRQRHGQIWPVTLNFSERRPMEAPSVDPNAWDWDQFGTCLAYGGTVAAVECAFSGDPTMDCWADEVMGNVLYCALEQIL